MNVTLTSRAGAKEGVERQLAASLSLQLGCPIAVASLLVSRGIPGLAEAMAFFSPSLQSLGDPSRMLGVDVAVARIQRALVSGEPILIYGDYDVDGTTATALLKKAIELAASPDRPAVVTYHVPHRLREGYGMHANVLSQAAASGIRLIISVDTGIRAFAAAAEAKAQGLDLIVTDHHLPDEAAGLPEALAVINPAQDGCGYGFKSLCGAAVSFKLAHALLRACAKNAAASARVETTLVPSFLKLVAIATIADSVPLDGENRAIVALGLRELVNPVQPGLRALFEVSQIAPGKAPTPSQIGFRVAPRINAAGRMDVAGDVVELLLTRDVAQASALAEKLDRLNGDRRAIEAEALEAIEKKLEEMRAGGEPLSVKSIVLDAEGWHRGVLGILASRVVDQTALPTLVLTHENGEAHGSGRSVSGFHLLDALTAVQSEMESGCGGSRFFTRFGGHAHAVGFSLPSGRVPQLRESLEEYAQSIPVSTFETGAQYDLELPFGDLTADLFHWVMRLAPFGIGNPEPVFLSRNVALVESPRFLQEKHLCLRLSAGGNGIHQSAIGWSRSISWLERCEVLRLQKGSCVDVVYCLREKSNQRFGLFDLDLKEVRLPSFGEENGTIQSSAG